jgi:hypothetical protein
VKAFSMRWASRAACTARFDADYLLYMIAVTFATITLLQVCAEVDVKLRAALKAGVPVTGAAASISSSSDDSTSDDGDADDDVVTESAFDREAMTV